MALGKVFQVRKFQPAAHLSGQVHFHEVAKGAWSLCIHSTAVQIVRKLRAALKSALKSVEDTHLSAGHARLDCMPKACQ